MIDFSRPLIPTTLRLRYILVAFMLFVLLAIITVFGWYSVKQGVRLHHQNMEILADIEKTFHEFNSHYQDVKFTTLEFMVEPDDKHYQGYQHAINVFLETFEKLKNTHNEGIKANFHEQINVLENDIQQCQRELNQVIQVRQDAAKTFPFSTTMLALNSNNIAILSTINGILLSGRAHNDLPYEAEKLFSDIRYTWVRMMAEFRLLVSVRFGIFSGDWAVAYKNRLYNIDLYIEKLNSLLKKLKKVQAKQQFTLETASDVEHIYKLIENGVKFYQYAINMLGRPDWRQDIVLLGKKIHPAFDRLDKSIDRLHIKVDQLRSASMMQLTSVAQQLSDTLWFLFIVGSLFIMLGYFIFSRIILRPIRHVTQALKDEALGQKVILYDYSSAQEICNLIEAFDEMRKQVKSRQQRLVNILDNAAEAIITIDENADIETFNSAAEKLSGYQSADVLGKNVCLLLPEDKCTDYQKLFEAYLRGSREQGATVLDRMYEFEILSYSAQLIPVSVKISKTFIDGKTLHTALLVDISERLANEQERQQHLTEMAHAGRLSIMGEMAAGIAHELNQPLAAILLYLQTGLRRCEPGVEACKDISKAIDSSIEQVKRASDIIRKMRGFAHRETFHLENVDLNILIQKSIDLVLMSQQDVSPQAELILAPSPLIVSVDALQIEQVLVNLILNAFESQQNIPAEKRILQVKSEIDDTGFAHVLVIDAGEGVKQENVNKIFDIYFTTKVDGLGMGLSICRSIIEQHDGVLWYRAVDDSGSGSQFCFVLPLLQAENS